MARYGETLIRGGLCYHPYFGALAFAGVLVLLLLVPSVAQILGDGGPPESVARQEVGVLVRPVENADPTLSIHLPGGGATGTNVISLESGWGIAPGGCTLNSTWVEWWLPDPRAASGTFLVSGSAHTAFVPSDLSVGRSEVGVRSDAVLTCGSAHRTLEGLAFANVTTYPPLALGGLSVTPNASPPPATVHLTGVVVGGRAPFILGVGWGDGTTSLRSVTSDGPFEFAHSFGPGTFRPRVGVYDSNHIDVRSIVPEPVEVTNGTADAINASLPLAEVGVPVGFTATAQRPVAQFGQVVACSTDPIVLPPDNITNITCVPQSAGSLPVTFKVGAPVPALVTETTLDEPVTAAPELKFEAVGGAADRGTLAFVRLSISGGVAPFRVMVNWPNGTRTTWAGVPTDGDLLQAWVPESAGTFTVNGSVTDSLGVETQSALVRLVVDPPPDPVFQTNLSIGPTSTSLKVDATVSGGAAPSWWDIETTPAASADSSPAGPVENRTFVWVGEFREESAGFFQIHVLDSAGTWAGANVSVGLPSPPVLTFSTPHVSTTGPPEFNLTLTPEGGVLPFGLWVNSTNTLLWNGSETASGPLLLSFPVPAGGSTVLNITLVDVRGARASVSIPVVVRVPDTPPPVSTVSSEVDAIPWVVAGLLAALGGGLVAVRRLRREEAPDPPTPDPAAVLERLLRPAEGADRLTIELLAEEEGVPLEVVHRELDRLIREDRIRSETDPNRGEVLAWSDA